MFERRDYALLFCACAGLVMDSFVVETPTLALWRLLLAVAVMSVVAEQVLTNRSVTRPRLWSWSAGAVNMGWLFIEEKILILRGIPAVTFPSWAECLGTVVWDLAITVGLFVFGMFVMRRYLRPRRLLSRYG